MADKREEMAGRPAELSDAQADVAIGGNAPAPTKKKKGGGQEDFLVVTLKEAAVVST